MANPQPDQFIKISRELWWALTNRNLPDDVRRVFNVVVGFTYGFGKKEASIKIHTLMRYTGLGERQTYRAIQTGIAMRMIIRVTAAVRGKGATYRIQKDYDQWLSLTDTVSVTGAVRGIMTGAVRVTGEKKPRKPAPVKPHSKPRKNPIDKHFIDSNTTESKKQDSDLFIIESYFKKVHSDEWGTPYRVNFAKDRKLINLLLRNHSTDELIKMVDRLAALVVGPDKFFSEFSISRLSQHQAKLLQDINKKSPLDSLPSYTKEEMEAIDRAKRR